MMQFSLEIRCLYVLSLNSPVSYHGDLLLIDAFLRDACFDLHTRLICGNKFSFNENILSVEI